VGYLCVNVGGDAKIFGGWGGGRFAAALRLGMLALQVPSAALSKSGCGGSGVFLCAATKQEQYSEFFHQLALLTQVFGQFALRNHERSGRTLKSRGGFWVRMRVRFC
jgi:hypothetical protein